MDFNFEEARANGEVKIAFTREINMDPNKFAKDNKTYFTLAYESKAQG